MLKVFSIKKRYSDKIFSKEKRVEFRRQNVNVRAGDVCLVYTSSPVMEITGYFIVKEKIREPVKKLWKSTKEIAGISKREFEEYFEKCDQGTAITFKKVESFESGFEFRDLKEKNGFRPPQSYCGLNDSMLNRFKGVISR